MGDTGRGYGHSRPSVEGKLKCQVSSIFRFSIMGYPFFRPISSNIWFSVLSYPKNWPIIPSRILKSCGAPKWTCTVDDKRQRLYQCYIKWMGVLVHPFHIMITFHFIIRMLNIHLISSFHAEHTSTPPMFEAAASQVLSMQLFQDLPLRCLGWWSSVDKSIQIH